MKTYSTPVTIQYAHQTRPDSDPRPYALRFLVAELRAFPADDQFPVEYQVFIDGVKAGDAEPDPKDAVNSAGYYLMKKSEREFTYNK